MKSFTVKDTPGYRLRIERKKCLRPTDLNHVQFIQEVKDNQGEVDFSSTYEFFLTDEEINNLAKELIV